ncbi:MAG TPA: hypothetical protein VII93_10635 [Anaerolineales bacterium]
MNIQAGIALPLVPWQAKLVYNLGMVIALLIFLEGKFKIPADIHG